MDTVHQGDLILFRPEVIDGQRVLGSTEFWDEVDELSVEDPDRASLTEPWQARVSSVSSGCATVVPYGLANEHGISAGDKLGLQLNTRIDGKPGTTTTPPGMAPLLAPDATLGDKVTAVVYQIHEGIAYLKPVEVNGPGLSLGDTVPVEVHRMENTGYLDLDGFGRLPVTLENTVVIGGQAEVELTQVEASFSGKIVGFDFIPQVGDEFEMAVTRGSETASSEWTEMRGVESIHLHSESIASDSAEIRITEVGETFKGEIVGYCNPPEPGDEVRAMVCEDQRDAHSINPAYELRLEEPAELSGEAKVRIQDGIERGEEFLPPRATIISYEQLPAAGEVINASVGRDGQTATTYRDDHVIQLTEQVSGSGPAKIKVTDVDRTRLRGHVEQFELGDLSDDDIAEGNPFSNGDRSRNDDLTGRKL